MMMMMMMMMSSERLKMNSEKTGFISLASKQWLTKIQCQFICLNGVNTSFNRSYLPGSSDIPSAHFHPHVQCLARRYFYCLRQIRTARRSLTTDSATTLVHALIANRFDYSNNVLYRININATKTLQSVLHSARLSSCLNGNLIALNPLWHWLPVPQRIVYKLYRLLQSTFKSCVCECVCVSVTTTASCRHLCSATASKLWSSLPLPIRD